MVTEGIMSKQEALEAIDNDDIQQLMSLEIADQAIGAMCEGARMHCHEALPDTGTSHGCQQGRSEVRFRQKRNHIRGSRSAAECFSGRDEGGNKPFVRCSTAEAFAADAPI
jgi:hypothetical protein